MPQCYSFLEGLHVNLSEWFDKEMSEEKADGMTLREFRNILSGSNGHKEEVELVQLAVVRFAERIAHAAEATVAELRNA
jgi:hypothetical protein